MRQVYDRWLGWLHPGPNEIHPWRWRALGAWIVIFTVVVLINLNDTGNTSDQAKNAARQAKIAALQIQNQRKETIHRTCVDQNARHDNTIVALRKIFIGQILTMKFANPDRVDFLKTRKDGKNITFAQIIHSMPKARQVPISQSIRNTLLLIESLAPRQNCAAIVKLSVKVPPPTITNGDNK